jgi:hypothetical protein
LPDRNIHRVIEVAKILGWPYPGLQLVPGDHVARVLQQNLQHLEGLLLELDTASRFTHLSRVEISLKRSKPNRVRCPLRHLWFPAPGKLWHCH